MCQPIRATLATLLLAFALGAGASSQAPYVPDEMKSVEGEFSTKVFLRLHLVPATPTEHVRAFLWFHSDDRTVFTAVSYVDPSNPGLEPAFVVQENSTSFIPTAIAVEAPDGMAFYVAGYNPRTQQNVVERWNFADLATSQSIPPGGSEPILGVAFSVRRDSTYSIASSSGFGPIKTMYYAIPSDELWLFEESAPYAVKRINVATGAETGMFVNADLADLKTAASLLIDDTHPSGGGLTAVVFAWRPWHGAGPVGIASLDAATAYVFQDVNLDGTPDIEFATTYSELKSLDYFDHEVTHFSVTDF